MGLFDSYATDDSAPQGGLLDRLIAGLQNNAQNQQPMGAMPSDTASYDAPAAQPQPVAPAPIAPQAQPIAPTAAPQPIAPQAAAQPAPATPPQIQTPQPQNPLLRAAAALHSVAQGGSLYGAIVGAPDDPVSKQKAVLQQQYAALIGAGMSPQQATLAVLNPEAGKTLITQAFGPHNAENLGQGWIRDPMTGKVSRAYTPEQNDSFSMVQTGEDSLGRKTFSKLNKATGEMTPIAGAAGTDPNDNGLRGDASKTGQAYLDSLPAGEGNIVRGMTDATLPIPAGNALGKQIWVNRLADAKQADPNFDATQWASRIAGRKDFTSGKSSEMVRSANQAVAHIGSLIDSAGALNNGDYPVLNWGENKVSEALGSGTQGAWRSNANAVADEVSKFFKGAGISDHEIQEWKNNLSENLSPAQQRAQIGKLSELMQGGLDALDEKRTASIGQTAADKMGPLIKPAGQAILKRIDEFTKGSNGAAPGGTAPTGVKWSVVQ